MKLEQLKENSDGSVDFNISDLTDEEVMSLIRLGIIKALEDTIEEAKKYDPDLLGDKQPEQRDWITELEERTKQQ